ncbi:GD10364 [Drosophila simulans]|uniref:GD10364 n=1 Tax=Drosophila simulans TaxID=7240 RepID=B4QC28_DROSI|nr:GD10364 [Drosophila simulans]
METHDTATPSVRLSICLLDTIGKVFDKYGFRKGLSTLDAISTVTNTTERAIAGSRRKGHTKKYCLVLTLDIRNAFKTTDWAGTLVVLESTLGSREIEVTAGVPQGSVLESTKIVLLTVVAKELAAAEKSANTAAKAVETWLELASQKTDSLLISNRKLVETTRIHVGGIIEDLGVMLDTRFSFREHLEYAHKKASALREAKKLYPQRKKIKNL